MRSYKSLNNLVGWLVFAVAFVVYALTVEQTASFWDCGEFIAVSYKLMVPHPPGAPFYLLLGRLFSFLAMGDGKRAARAIEKYLDTLAQLLPSAAASARS